MFLESERLVIRKVKISDAPFYFTLFNDKDWIQFIYDKNLNSVEETEVYLKELITKNLKNKDLGFFTVILKDTNKAIGVSTALQRESLSFIDVGYGFLPEGRGKGYASEATKMMLNYIKTTFNQDKVLAFTKPENKKSQKLLLNLEFIYVGKQIIFDEKEDDVFEYYFI